MSTPFSIAASAYGQAQKLISQGDKPIVDPSLLQNSGPDFGELVAQNVQSVVEAGKVSDQLSMDMVSGKADIVDVVTAIAETEIAIESMVTIRDRVIKAYEEIMRMPI